MFRAAGYKSYPTMTMAGARVERIPADQFNHCVVAVDISGEPGVKSDNLPGTKYEMYDPTWIPNAMDVWSRAEGDQHIVIGSPEGEDLTKIRPYSAEENRFNITSRATIDKNGDLLGTLEIKALGYADGRLRRVIVYTGGSEDIWNRIANYISGIAPGAELTGYEHDDDQDFSKPMGLRINYKIPGYAIQYGDGLHFTSPSARFLPATSFLFQTFAIASLDKRTQPILAYSPWQVVMDETINVPKGYKLGEFKPVNKGGDFADFKASVKSASGTVKVAFEYKVTDRYVQPEQYPQVKEIVDGMNEFAHTNINLWSK
jgi:hypothetical protein